MRKFTQLLTLVLSVSLAFSTNVFADNASPKYKTIAENLPYSEATLYGWMGANLISVTDANNTSNTGYIDYDGKTILPPQQHDGVQCVNGYMLVKGKDGSYTLYDEKGNVKMSSATFEKALTGGYTVDSVTIATNIVGMYNDSSYKLVDFNGNELTGLTKLLSNSRGTIPIQEKLIKIYGDDMSSYFVDINGKPVLAKEKGYSYMDFFDGVVLKTEQDPSHNERVIPIAFYDANGNLVCSVPDIAKGSHDAASFSELYNATLLQFSEGYAAYEDKNTKLVGFIDKTGKIVIPARFKSCGAKFINGVAGVYLPNDDEHFTYIDTNGNVLFSIPSPDPRQYGNINELILNTYNVYDGPSDAFKVSVHDIKGNHVFSYDATKKTGGSYSYSYVFGSDAPVTSQTINSIGVDQYSRTVIISDTDNHYGLYDLNGNEILPTVYDYIQALGTTDGRLLLIKDRKLSIIQILAERQDATQIPVPTSSTAEYKKSANNGPVYYFNWDWSDEEGPEVHFNFSIGFPNGDVIFPPSQYKYLMVDGELIPEGTVLTNNSRALMPTQIVTDYLNADVKYDGKSQELTITKAEVEIILSVGSATAKVSGNDVSIDAPLVSLHGKLYVPLRFVVQNLGYNVGFYNKYPFYNHPLVWVESKPAHTGDMLTKEEAIETAKILLQKHLKQWNKENRTYQEDSGLKRALENISYVDEFSRFWVLWDGYAAADNTGFFGLLVDKYSGDVYYYRGAYSSYWIGVLDFDGFKSMYCAG